MAGKRTELAAPLGVGEWQARARARKGADPKETRRWHPPSGRSEWWLCGGVNTPAMSAVLAAFAQVAGAGQDKRLLVVLDRAGWHGARDLLLPEGIHLVQRPACTPELQPAERLWPPRREAVANESFADLAALDAKLDARCSPLGTRRTFIAGCTRFHWWPQT